MFARWAHLMYRRRWYVICVWVLLLAGAVLLALQAGSVLRPGDFTIPGSQSDRAAIILQRQFHQNTQTDLEILVVSHSGSIYSGAFATAVATVAGHGRVELVGTFTPPAMGRR
ncbi:MAG TPA: hypothetical protein VFB34_03525 [Chloroflexota bacterium]|nr:hypothetical protein [Chloroflexota bacterium]